MEIKNQTQYIEPRSYTGVISGAKNTVNGGGQSASKTDSVDISEEARQSAMAAEMEKDGMSGDTAEKLASGKLKFNEPDWDSYEVPVLQGQADPKIYNDAYFKAYTKKLGELTERVNAYYEPEYSKIRDMNSDDAMKYLFNTYKLPWMKDLFVEGTALPSPPDGMTRTESDMAYNQLKSMYCGNGHSVLRDPYALGEDGIKELNNIKEDAQKAAQEVYDAAQKEYDARQETWKAEQKEKYKQVFGRLKNGDATNMGYMSLRSEAGADGSAGSNIPQE